MKAHFVSSDEYLKEGTAQTAACGSEVKNCYFAMRVDTSGVTGRTMAALISANTLLLCKKCVLAPLPGRIVYMITEAQEMKDGNDAVD